MEFYPISWDEAMRMIKELAAVLEGKYIYGIPRGGTLVAAILSHHGCTQLATPGAADVIVDDIADSGQTLRAHSKPTATLAVRHGCAYMPTWWVTILQTKKYILFPWEDEAAVAEQTSFRSREN